MSGKGRSKSKPRPAINPEASCQVHLGEAILPPGVEWVLNVRASDLAEATLWAVELARMVEPLLKLEPHELPRADAYGPAGVVGLDDPEDWMEARRARKTVGF